MLQIVFILICSFGLSFTSQAGEFMSPNGESKDVPTVLFADTAMEHDASIKASAHEFVNATFDFPHYYYVGHSGNNPTDGLAENDNLFFFGPGSQKKSGNVIDAGYLMQKGRPGNAYEGEMVQLQEGIIREVLPDEADAIMEILGDYTLVNIQHYRFPKADIQGTTLTRPLCLSVKVDQGGFKAEYTVSLCGHVRVDAANGMMEISLNRWKASTPGLAWQYDPKEIQDLAVVGLKLIYSDSRNAENLLSYVKTKTFSIAHPKAPFPYR